MLETRPNGRLRHCEWGDHSAPAVNGNQYRRREDNQIVIDDPRVSRTHAQLRAVRGQYVLFDLSFYRWNYINGTRISQQGLKPGDVISLAGVPLIYGEEPTYYEEANPAKQPLELRLTRIHLIINPMTGIVVFAFEFC